MDGWKPYLHAGWRSGGAPFLFPSFVIQDVSSFAGAAVFTCGLCLFERASLYQVFLAAMAGCVLVAVIFTLATVCAIYPQYSVAVSGPHTLTRRTLIAAMALCRKLTFFRVALDSFLTYVLDFWLAEQPAHSLRRRVRTGSRSAIQQATVRAGLYWLVTLARYLLMLIAMGMDWVLLLILVTALACGQWVIELRKASSAGTELAHGTQSAEDDGAWEALYGTDGGDGSGMGPRKAPDEEHQTMYEHDEITLTEWPSGRTGRTEPKDDEARSLLGATPPNAAQTHARTASRTASPSLASTRPRTLHHPLPTS